MCRSPPASLPAGAAPNVPVERADADAQQVGDLLRVRSGRVATRADTRPGWDANGSR